MFHFIQRLVAVTILALLFTSQALADSRKINIAYCEFHITHKFAKAVTAEAYKKIGITANFDPRPCRRSLIEANAGAYDGEVGRIKGTTKNFPNLMELNAPVTDILGVAITKNTSATIESWKDLSPYRVGIVMGELYAEKGTAALKVEVANSYNQLLKLLLKDRIEIGIVIQKDWELAMENPEFRGEDIKIIGEPLFKANLHHLLHKDNKDLLEPLGQALREMYASGETESIHQQTFEQLTK